MNNEVFREFPVMETERLVFRQVDLADVEDLFAIISDPEVAKYDYFRPVQSIHDATRFIQRYHQEFAEKEEITWAIIRKENQRLVGICSTGNYDPMAQRCEIGYDIMQKHWNHGYGTEAIRAVVCFVFEELGMNRLEAWVTPGNDASVRVLEKAGFIQEGCVRERDYMKGELVDGIILAILKRDYFSLKKRPEYQGWKMAIK